MCKKIEMSEALVNGKGHAAFAAVTVDLDASELLAKPEFAKVRENPSRKVLLVARHDGRIGFPGGKVDEGETFAAAAARELREETGLISPVRDDDLLVSYEIPAFNVHVFRVHLGRRTVQAMRALAATFAASETYTFEVCPFWAPLSADPKIRERVLSNSGFVTSVRETLEELIRVDS